MDVRTECVIVVIAYCTFTYKQTNPTPIEQVLPTALELSIFIDPDSAGESNGHVLTISPLLEPALRRCTDGTPGLLEQCLQLADHHGQLDRDRVPNAGTDSGNLIHLSFALNHAMP